MASAKTKPAPAQDPRISVPVSKDLHQKLRSLAMADHNRPLAIWIRIQIEMVVKLIDRGGSLEGVLRGDIYKIHEVGKENHG